MSSQVRRLFIVVWCALLFGSLAAFASAQSEPDPDTTSAVGLTFKDADIAAAVRDFEAGRVTESIDRLIKLVKDKAARDDQRVRELRAAAAMLQLRTRETEHRKAAFATLANLIPGETDLARRAQVIRLIGDTKVKDGTKGVEDLKPRESWLEHLGQVKRYLETKLNETDKDMDRAVAGERWGGLKVCLEASSDFVEQMEVIKIQLEDQTDIVATHARRLELAARVANDKAEDHIDRAAVYKDQLRGLNPRAVPGKKGQINEEYRDARQACDACERIVKAYNELQSRYPRRIKPLHLEPNDVPRDVR